MSSLLLGFASSFLVSIGAFLKRSLSVSGFIAAIALGGLLYYFGGFFFWLILISFFLSSSLLSHYKKNAKKGLNRLHARGSRRDYTQVLANGLPGLIFAFAFYLTDKPVYILAFATAMASANADTWASELGVLSKGPTVSILTFKPVKRGLSGGISLLGTVASLLGSLFIALVFLAGYVVIYGPSWQAAVYAGLCTLGGFLGSIIDSLLGSSVQAKYLIPERNEITERPYNETTANQLVGGVPFVNNDVVNFCSGLLAPLLVMALMGLA